MLRSYCECFVVRSIVKIELLVEVEARKIPTLESRARKKALCGTSTTLSR